MTPIFQDLGVSIKEARIHGSCGSITGRPRKGHDGFACTRVTILPSPKAAGTKEIRGMDDAVEKSAMRKIYWRLLPFAVLSYFLA